MGKTIKDVCLQPKQFSCWNSNNPNRKLLLTLDTNSELYENIRKIVEQI
jgi:hypothetical protein